MFDLGMQELIIIFIVTLIVFGPKRLPELARSLGKGISELKKTLHGVKDQIDTEIEEIEKPIKEDLYQAIDRSDFNVEDLYKKAEQRAADNDFKPEKPGREAEPDKSDDKKQDDMPRRDAGHR